jgi:peptidyl-dipeptidase A
VEPDARWFGTSHHELGHIYYYLSYARPEVPLVLRAGANRAFHEGIGELINIAATQVPYLRQAGILPESQQIDQTRWLLNEALEETVAFLPWSAGVMASWERDLYETDLPPEQWNARWWEHVRRFQGVEPPETRGEELCDGCTKTHVNDDPGQYYDYAIATVLKYQLHAHICRDILQQDPHSCNYYGSRPVGNFLRTLLAEGARRDWRELLRDKTGQDLSTKPMMDYFSPLLEHLRKENAGRQCGW